MQKLAQAERVKAEFNSKHQYGELAVRCGSRSPKDEEFGHFTLLFRIARLRDLTRCTV